jgi:hypothetical protein
LSVCAIAELTGFDRKTVRKYLAHPDQRSLLLHRTTVMVKLMAGNINPHSAEAGEFSVGVDTSNASSESQPDICPPTALYA